MNLKNFKITNKGLYWGLIVTFLLLYVFVAFVSTLHAIDFFKLANPLSLAILLGVSYEVGQASVLFSILMTKNKEKFLPWALMFLLTGLQITANVYASFKHIMNSGSTDWIYWQKSILFGVQATSPEMYQVIISWISGALLPIIALGMTALVAQQIKLISEESEEKLKKEKESIPYPIENIPIPNTNVSKNYVDDVKNKDDEFDAVDLSKEEPDKLTDMQKEVELIPKVEIAPERKQQLETLKETILASVETPATIDLKMEPAVKNAVIESDVLSQKETAKVVNLKEFLENEENNDRREQYYDYLVKDDLDKEAEYLTPEIEKSTEISDNIEFPTVTPVKSIQLNLENVPLTQNIQPIVEKLQESLKQDTQKYIYNEQSNPRTEMSEIINEDKTTIKNETLETPLEPQKTIDNVVSETITEKKDVDLTAPEIYKEIEKDITIPELPKKRGRPYKQSDDTVELKKEQEPLQEEDVKVPEEKRPRFVNPLNKKTKIKQINLKEIMKPSKGDEVIKLIESMDKAKQKVSIIPEETSEEISHESLLVPPEILNPPVEVIDGKAIPVKEKLKVDKFGIPIAPNEKRNFDRI